MQPGKYYIDILNLKSNKSCLLAKQSNKLLPIKINDKTSKKKKKQILTLHTFNEILHNIHI